MQTAALKDSKRLSRSLPPWWVLGGTLAGGLILLAAIVSSLWLDTKTQPAVPSPLIPKIDYRALISAESGKANAQTDVIVKNHQASLAKLDQAHAPKFVLAASSAAEQAATYPSIAKLIGYLAWDMAKGTSEAESCLNKVIDPSITPALSDFHNEVNAETARFDYELRKVTVQLATNIAAIGPGGAPQRPRFDSQEDTLRNFQQILKTVGWKGTFAGASIGLSMSEFVGKSILPKLIKPIGAIAGRMFAKQIAKVAALPIIASATGPVPIGPILVVIGAAWTAYDIYRLRPEFQDEVYQKLRTNLDEIRTSTKAHALKSASIKSEEIQKIQRAIVFSALDDFTKQETK